ncbi:Mitochondrial cytochrome c oxidase (complex IV) assembly factor COX14 [Kluyveromyces marxianus]|uniref:Mitochondrial cytochrome c oxidase (Complex IV) assembly factor COX14 n=1 Tax=Kluyveromyces marxianus TaxID=4911 RepID=A0ABX6ERH4_KLUMA|nr:Mitochondrial cytochrome c oxidase (complex IV) assembly factor COX14 [Kluyveromyces marxianus]
MAKYAWYTRVTDAAHRLTVLTLLGGTLYMGGGLVYTLYQNGKRYEEEQLKAQQQGDQGSNTAPVN